MDKYTGQTELNCNVVTSPSYQPVIFQELSRRPHISATRRQAIEEFLTSAGVTETYRIGDELNDLSLDIVNLSDADSRFLDEIARRNIPAYIYSSVPGTLMHHIPLTRGVGGDPSDGTYTATVASGTTVFFPRGDSANVAYLEETDFTDNIILADGLQEHSGTFSTLSHELPLGRGAAVLSKKTNQVQNSGLDDDGTDIHNWTLSKYGGGAAADGINRRNETGWMGVQSLQLFGNSSGTGDIWTADGWDASGVRSKKAALSFGWRTDGELLVEIAYGDGGGWGPLVTLDKGSGYYRGQITVEALANDIDLRWSNDSGTYSEICAVQVVIDSDTPDDYQMYYPYLEGLGEDTNGQITSCNLKYDIDATATGWVASPNDDSALIVSGFIQPLHKARFMDAVHKVYSLHHSLTGKEVELHMRTAGNKLKLYLRANATALCNVEITDFGYGDTLYVAMVAGWDSGTATKGIYCRIVGGDTTYSATDTGASNFYSIFDELYIGTDHNGASAANALIQDINVWAGTITPCCQVTDMVEYLADTDNLMEHRLTLGRLYRFSPNLSPSPWNRGKVSGTIQCKNVEAI